MTKRFFELQYFGQGPNPVATTTNYVNPYTGETTAWDATHTMSPEMKTYYDTELLENARPNLVHAQFGKRAPLPAHKGKTIEFRRFNTLNKAAALTEGVIPEASKFGSNALTATITQYGDYVAISDMLDLHAIDPVLLEATKELGAAAGITLDEYTRDALMEGTNVMYCPKINTTTGAETEVTSRATLDATAILTPKQVNKAVTILKKANAPKINGKYVAIIHPSVAYDLRQSPEWIEAHKYAAVTELFNGEIGELHGVRFVETTEAKIYKGSESGAIATYCTLFLGQDAYGIIAPDGAGLQMITKPASQVGGPLEQFSTAGYKLSTAAKILYQDRILRVESGSSYSAVDEAN